MLNSGCVYIMTNQHHTVLYIGVTSDLIGRVYEHKTKAFPNRLTDKYNFNKCNVRSGPQVERNGSKFRITRQSRLNVHLIRHLN